MRNAELYRIAGSLAETEQEDWKTEFMQSMKQGFQYPEGISFEGFLSALYIGVEKTWLREHTSVIAYGAGNMAKDFLPEIQKYVDIIEIWDAFSKMEFLYGIPIVRLREKAEPEIPMVVFLEDGRLRGDVAATLKEKGCREIYYYKDFMQIAEALPCLKEVMGYVTEGTIGLLKKFLSQYEIIQNEYTPVNYAVFPKKLISERLELGDIKECAKLLAENLKKRLVLCPSKEKEIEGIVETFLSKDLENAFSFAYETEIFLRKLLSDGVKTIERPIRMFNDSPYDRFAVLETVRDLVSCLSGGEKKKELTLIRLLRNCSEDSIPLMSAECLVLAECKEWEQALQLARREMKKDPNDLLANETFYQVAVTYKQNGGTVEEPLPEYDLKERFCWSGFTFALCHGFDMKSGKAEFLPCFRTLQCGANPAGAFWSGEEWREFRKSIMDGSFKYCQKNQCTNLVAGWLPRKDACIHKDVKKWIEGDETAALPLEELHFSYDSHCNLKCPSCRLEIKTITNEETEKMDVLYEKNLKPMVDTAKHLCLSGCGEAMLSPHSRKILQSLSREKNPELAVELRTNVTSFRPRLWESLGEGRKLIRHVAASIDAASKEKFERLRFPAKWEVVLENLEFIQRLRSQGEIDLFEFHVVVQSENIEELSDIARMAIRFGADAVTYSRLVNWRGMTEEEYQEVNPFWHGHPQHERMVQAFEELKSIRDAIEAGEYEPLEGGKKVYINIHFYPDPNSSYNVIRNGRLKIR